MFQVTYTYGNDWKMEAISSYAKGDMIGLAREKWRDFWYLKRIRRT
jgi:hypothetical protein